MGDGDRSGLEAVYLAHRPELLRFLTARLRDPHAAEEVLQELWFKLAGTAHGPIAAPLAYLYRAALNGALDRRRATARGAGRDRNWTAATVEALAGDAVDQQPSAERALIARQRLARVEAMLGTLPERTATIFRRFRFDGMTQRDIAAEHGISVSAVEKHVATALKAVLAALDEDRAADGAEDGAASRRPSPARGKE